MILKFGFTANFAYFTSHNLVMAKVNGERKYLKIIQI